MATTCHTQTSAIHHGGGIYGAGAKGLVREGPEPRGLGGSLRALKGRVLGDVSQGSPSEQYHSLPSSNKTGMLNPYTDGQDVMLTKHTLRTRTFLFNNQPLVGPSFSSTA